MEDVTQTGEMEILSDEDKFTKLELLNFVNLLSLWPTIVFLLLLAVIGLVGNVMVLLVYWRKFPASTARIFILSLAAVDLMSCVLAIPGELVDFRFYFNFPSAELCRFFRFNNAFTSIGSGILILPMAADRYRRICRPMQRQMTHLAAQVSIACSLLISVLLASPFIALSGNRSVTLVKVNATLCSFSDETLQNDSHVAFLYVYFIVVVVCFIVLIVLYTLIGVQVWRRKRFQSGSPLSSSSQRAWRRRPPPPAPSTDTVMPSESDSSVHPGQEAGDEERSVKGSWRRHFLDKLGKKPRVATARFYGDSLAVGTEAWVQPGHAASPGNSKPLALSNRAFVASVHECEEDCQVDVDQPEPLPNTLQGNGQNCRHATEEPSREQNANDRKPECPSCREGKIGCDCCDGCEGCDSHQPIKEESGVEENMEELCKEGTESTPGVDTDNAKRTQKDGGENNNTKVTFADVNSVCECEASDRYLPELNGHAEQALGLELVSGVWTARFMSEASGKNSILSDEDTQNGTGCGGDDGVGQSLGKEEDGDRQPPQGSVTLSHVTLSDSECWSTDEECLDMPRGLRCHGNAREAGTQEMKFDTPSPFKPADCEEQERGKSRLARLCPCLSRDVTQRRPSFPIRRSNSRPVRASRTTLIIFVIAVVFIMSYLPFLLLMVLREMDDDFEKNMTPEGRQCYNVFLRTFFINAASNPIIYSFLNVRFRKECRKLLSPPAWLRCS